jgi:hypothetical protein
MLTRTPPFANRRASAVLAPFRAGVASAVPCPAAGSRRKRLTPRHRPTIEMMEERTLLSGVSIPNFETVPVSPGTDPLIPLQAMEITSAYETLKGPGGSLLNPSSWTPLAPQSVQVQLQAGEILTTSISPLTANLGGLPSAELGADFQITGPTGQKVTAGSSSDDQAAVFAAPATGAYTITVTDPNAEIFTSGTLTLSLRPIALSTAVASPADNASDAALYSYTQGGLYAWLSGGASADKGASLTFSGPTGIGFQMAGKWSESITGSTITYTDTASIGLTIGDVTSQLPLPSGAAFIVTAQTSDSSNLFGQVTGEQFALDGTSLNSLIGPLATMSNFSFPSGGVFLPRVSVGIGLGSSAGVEATDLPVDPAVPYLYFSVTTTASLSYGTATVVSDPYHVGVAIDPTDPSIGVDIQGIPGLNEVALEVSENATIPYSPQAVPEQYAGNLYGDVYFKGTVDLGALTGGALPAAAASSLTANLDPGHKGLTDAMSQTFGQFLGGHMTASAAMQYLDNISLGINGEVDLTLGLSSLATIVVPVAEASMIYDGPSQTFYVHADSIDLFANTPLASFLPNSAKSFDGTINFADGQFQFTAEEDLTFVGASVSGSLRLSNSGVFLAFDPTLSDSFSQDGFDGSINIYLTDTLSIQFDSSGELSYSLTSTGSATASWDGHGCSFDNLSYSCIDEGTLSDVETQLLSFTNYILNDVENGVEAWAENIAESIWDQVKNWFDSHF